jgi:hypothetical protein
MLLPEFFALVDGWLAAHQWSDEGVELGVRGHLQNLRRDSFGPIGSVEIWTKGREMFG